MPTYIVLGHRTLQGAQSQTVQDLPQRREARRSAARTLGITEVVRLFTLGDFATVEVFEAPDDETIARYVLQLAKRGNYQFETIRAYGESEWEHIIGGLGPMIG
jgi:uncharacterized protein with GYD domain